MSAQVMQLEPWHQQMVDNGAMTLRQAAEMQLLQEATPADEWIVLPPHLQEPGKRASLFESPPANSLPL